MTLLNEITVESFPVIPSETADEVRRNYKRF